MTTVDQLCIGTVKFGMPQYGFSLSSARAFDARAFVRAVIERGIARFDTAPRYGNSESVLGEALEGMKTLVWISSKAEGLAVGSSGNRTRMEASIRRSLERLRRPYLDVCYLHQNEREILEDASVHDGLSRLKESGMIRAAGASVYTHEECQAALESGIFDYIQVPVSVLDLGFYDRFITRNTTPVKFVARSLLLQGLIANRGGIAERIQQSDDVIAHLSFLDEHARSLEMSPLEMALAFVFTLPGIDHMIVGTTDLDHVEKNLQCMKLTIPKHVHAALYTRAMEPHAWTNPRMWQGQSTL